MPTGSGYETTANKNDGQSSEDVVKYQEGLPLDADIVTTHSNLKNTEAKLGTTMNITPPKEGAKLQIKTETGAKVHAKAKAHAKTASKAKTAVKQKVKSGVKTRLQTRVEK